jgi:hypothetical protein
VKARIAWGVLILAAAVLAAFLPLGTLVQIGDDVLIRAAFYSALGFVVLYSTMAPWWRSPMGRMIVALDFAIVLTLLPDILMQDFGADLPAQVTLRLTAAGIGTVVVTIISRAWLLGRIHSWQARLPWKHPHGRHAPDPGNAAAERPAP